jgi:hypothetical protein
MSAMVLLSLATMLTSNDSSRMGGGLTWCVEFEGRDLAARSGGFMVVHASSPVSALW